MKFYYVTFRSVTHGQRGEKQLKQEGYQIHLILPDAVDEDGNADNVVAYLPGQDSTKAVVLGAAPGATGSVQGGGQPKEPDPACV